MSTDPNIHETCLTDDCDCTCAGCMPKECKTCPHCGAEIDGAPADGGVTDPWDSDSYQAMTPVERRTAWDVPRWDVPLRTAQLTRNVTFPQTDPYPEGK